MSQKLTFPQFKSPSKRYLTTSEASAFCNVTNSTLYSWEKDFPMLSPARRKGNRRYYNKSDIQTVFEIQHLLEGGMSTPDARLCLATGQRMRQQIYLENKHAENLKEPSDLNIDLGFHFSEIVRICRVSERTAKRYLKEGKAPYAACRLLELEKRGRILPDKWNYCFINSRGNLEIHSVGEVRENDILNIRWSRQLYADHVRTLQRELEDKQERILELQLLLSEARADLGHPHAANDPFRD